MKPNDIFRLILLAAIWGGSYVFIRMIVPVFGAVGTMWLRILIGGLALLAYAAITRAELGLRQWWRQYLLIGLMNSVIPFTLISYAMKTLPAGYGAILNALSPIFAAIFAVFLLQEKLTGLRVFGMLLSLCGVAMIMNLGPVPVNAEVLIAAGMSILATISYGYISVYAKKYAIGAPNMGVAAGALILPAFLAAPVAIPFTIWVQPSMTALLALAALGIFCSAIAYVLYYGLVRDVGPTKAISVTFLIPLFGVLWGALFLGERFTVGAAIGGGVVLLGMALVLGLLGPKNKVIP